MFFQRIVSAATMAVFLVVLIPPVSLASEAKAAERLAVPSSDANVPGAGPLRRSEWFKGHWLQRRTAFAQTAEQDQGAVVFLGDSITEGWGGALGAAFPGMRVANRGISGDTSRGVLHRLEEDVLALRPAAVVLLIGTNDLADGASPEVIAANVGLILAQFRQHDPDMPVVFNQVFPSSATKDRPPERIEELNARYLEVVRGNSQVTLIETWPLFADAEGNARPAEFPDLLHLNEQGYALWAAALRPVLETLELLPTERDPFCPEPGFEMLFNGKDLTGWGYRPTSEEHKEIARAWQARDPNAAEWPFVTESSDFDGLPATPDGRFVAVNDRLVVTTTPRYRLVQELWTQREFPEDFVLKLEFRATPNADGGVFLRGRQLQCRDYALAGPYDLEKYKPQDWNELIITVRGEVAHATCNGEVLEEAFPIPETGPIGFEADRGQMEFRRIRIQHGS